MKREETRVQCAESLRVQACFDGELDGAVRGEDDDREVRGPALDLCQHVEPALAVEAEVEQHQIDRLPVEQVQRAATPLLRAHAVLVMLEAEGDELTQVGFIVHDDDVRRGNGRWLGRNSREHGHAGAPRFSGGSAPERRGLRRRCPP